jgi:hypothetical protein
MSRILLRLRRFVRPHPSSRVRITPFHRFPRIVL